MSVRSRVALVAIVAVAIVGGFLPHGLLAPAQSTAAEAVQLVETPLASLPACADVTCGKGTPAAPAPAPMVVLAGVLGGLAVVAIAAGRLRHRRAQVTPLPAGSPNRLLRPPQFS
ncbi:MAG TPA: hypothetical protein VG346_05225 [Acidimicrobiales bacterium]|jgi:hypothetical protein|nr:hypothetical protein [Acidimicrobiales bacterium]